MHFGSHFQLFSIDIFTGCLESVMSSLVSQNSLSCIEFKVRLSSTEIKPELKRSLPVLYNVPPMCFPRGVPTLSNTALGMVSPI